MLKICFFVSGGGGNMKFLHLAKQMHKLENFRLTVIADRSCNAVDFAKENMIDAEVISYNRNNNQALLNVLHLSNPDIIITTWAKIIDKDIVMQYSGKMINLHYSLLPAFAGQMGLDPIKNAYKQNCQYVGVTCHYVDENVDTGKIISQAIVQTSVPMKDAIEEVFRKGCLILLNSIMIVTEKRFIEQKDNKQIDYSPRLIFDDSMFDKEFWKTLASL